MKIDTRKNARKHTHTRCHRARAKTYHTQTGGACSRAREENAPCIRRATTTAEKTQLLLFTTASAAVLAAASTHRCWCATKISQSCRSAVEARDRRARTNRPGRCSATTRSAIGRGLPPSRQSGHEARFRSLCGVRGGVNLKIRNSNNTNCKSTGNSRMEFDVRLRRFSLLF